MQTNLNVGNFLADLSKQMQKNLQKCALYVKLAEQNKVSRTQPISRSKGIGVWFHGLDVSSPGEAPKRVTSDFYRSITAEARSDKWVIGSALPRADWLESGTTKMAARPSWSVVLQEEQGAMAKILQEGLK